MSIESLVAAIQRLREEEGSYVPSPASEQDIAGLRDRFLATFRVPLPTAYERVLRASNGIMFDGLTVWPTHPYWRFPESLIEANEALRETVEDSWLYLGKRDDVLFVSDPRRRRFAAVEMSGLSEWESFDDAESLVTFMLQRVVDENAG